MLKVTYSMHYISITNSVTKESIKISGFKVLLYFLTEKFRPW